MMTPGRKEDTAYPHDDKFSTLLSKPFHLKSVRKALMKALGLAPSQALAPEMTYGKRSGWESSGISILIVEDNATNQQIAKALLENAGMITQIAGNGKEAVDVLMNTDFDAVLMDIQMPLMDGIEATRSIRNDLKKTDLPIIAMTANALKGDQEKCLSAGMDGYITKPIIKEELLEAIEKQVSLRKMQTVNDTDKKESAVTDLPGIAMEEFFNLLGFNLQTVIDILRSFYQSNQGKIKTLMQLHYNGEKEAFWRELHSLKGASASIRAHTLHQVVKELEEKTREIVNDDGASLLDVSFLERIESEMSVVMNSIEKLLAASY